MAPQAGRGQRRWDQPQDPGSPSPNPQCLASILLLASEGSTGPGRPARIPSSASSGPGYRLWPSAFPPPQTPLQLPASAPKRGTSHPQPTKPGPLVSSPWPLAVADQRLQWVSLRADLSDQETRTLIKTQPHRATET